MSDAPPPSPAPAPAPAPEPALALARRRPLPAGYREGIITAVTVIIGFSLSFVRYWAFEAPGDWSVRSIVALIALLIPIAAEIYTLYRALLVEDDDEATYKVTVKWFIGSVCGMLVSVSLAAIVLSGRP